MKTILEYIEQSSMRSQSEYIKEQLQINEAFVIIKPTAKTASIAAKFEDNLKNFLKSAKKRYSFNNKQDLQQFFKDFCDYRGEKVGKMTNSELKTLGITDGKTIAQKMIANKEKLEKEGWNLDPIKSFDESASEKEYKTWKNSDNYVQGKKVNRDDYKDADEEELKRTLVIYYVNDPGNPDTTLEFPFSGSRKSNDHQAHMYSMEWKYETGLKYFDARQILLSNYLKKSDAELTKREVALTDDDIEEI